MLEYCVESSYRMKTGLVMVLADLAKAFDSVDREEMMRVMERNRIDGLTIDLLRDVYGGDKTKIFRDGREMGQTAVTRGIRQGCTVSPQLFVMVVDEIIWKLQDSRMGYRDINMYLQRLFYTDDGLLLMRSVGEAMVMVRNTELIAGKFGLKINRSKNKCLICNARELGRAIPDDIEGDGGSGRY